MGSLVPQNGYQIPFISNFLPQKGYQIALVRIPSPLKKDTYLLYLVPLLRYIVTNQQDFVTSRGKR